MKAKLIQIGLASLAVISVGAELLVARSKWKNSLKVERFVQHTVQPYEDFYSIAQQYNPTIDLPADIENQISLLNPHTRSKVYFLESGYEIQVPIFKEKVTSHAS